MTRTAVYFACNNLTNICPKNVFIYNANLCTIVCKNVI